MTTSLDSVDLAHASRRARFVRPALERPAWSASTPERVEREVPPQPPKVLRSPPSPAPTSDWMEAPAWPGPSPAGSVESPSLAAPGPTLVAVVEPRSPVPAVPRALAVAAISPRLECEESLEPPLERAWGPAEPELDDVSAEWFVQGAREAFFERKPAGPMPWWALWIPGVAAAGTILILVALLAATAGS